MYSVYNYIINNYNNLYIYIYKPYLLAPQTYTSTYILIGLNMCYSLYHMMARHVLENWPVVRTDVSGFSEATSVGTGCTVYMLLTLLL